MTVRAANEARRRAGRGSQPIKSFGDGVICGSSQVDCSERTYLYDDSEDHAKPASRAWQSNRRISGPQS